ncbi:hypothetical protein [Acinetobacter sp. YH16055]|uniref:hypothetical protein n=1 Tax=Acinetobacter sp. YH16055 TaxID=2601193 RepID=UPI0015D281D8|nr:hypothetical protein [Acinetobacter sp. YH16055]
MTEPSHVVKMIMLQAMAASLDIGDGHATMVYCDGVRPLSEEVLADPSARLVTLTLPKPCIKQVNENSIELYPSDAAVAIKTSTATWARLYNASGQAVIDLDMGVEIQLDNYEIVLGSTQQLDAIFIEPE